MVLEPLPAWLKALTERIDGLGLYPAGATANHVLINEYLSGQGIMPHEDGPLYYPTIATVSTGTHTLLNFYSKVKGSQDAPGSAARDEDSGSAEHKSRAPPFSLLLERNSLLILRSELYHMLHGIEEVTEDVIDPATIANYACCADPPPAGARLQRETRVSFTIRHVLKTVRLRGALLFGAQRK